MKTYDLLAQAASAVSARADRPATAVVHDSADARLVIFRIEPGQTVAPHTNPSTVMLSVIAGSGNVSDAEGERSVRAGQIVTYDPGELHGMRAGDERLVILAMIAPRPGAAR
ncbi:MAG: AraC family ligand binding domain-containing protein [Gemmatimonadaceae bacterium]|nr:AraC family ligand binding domain-containing protein [Gemmatimonadaceae bacterium]